MSLELSRTFIDAYNRRDADAIRALVADDVSYVRPGQKLLTSPDEVVGIYQKEWGNVSRSRVDVRDAWHVDDAVCAEITVTVEIDGAELQVEGGVFHGWKGGKLVRYRLYLDPLPGAA